MNQGIVVITDNGAMPRDGGKRLGYRVGNTYYPIGGGKINLVPPAPVTKPEPPVAAGKLPVLEAKYMSIGVAKHRDGECWSCHKYPNRTRDMQTDLGVRPVVECDECGELMRPLER